MADRKQESRTDREERVAALSLAVAEWAAVDWLEALDDAADNDERELILQLRTVEEIARRKGVKSFLPPDLEEEKT